MRVLILLLLAVLVFAEEIRLGVLESDPNLVAVCDMAIQKAREGGIAESVLVLNVAGCEGRGTADAARLLFEENVAGIVASRCVQETLEVARLSYFENVPVIERIGHSAALFNNAQNPTLVSVALSSVVGFAKALRELMHHFHFESLTLVGPAAIEGEREAPMHLSLASFLQNDPKHGTPVRTFDFSDKTSNDDFFDSIDLDNRLIVFAGDRKSSNAFFKKVDLSTAADSGFMIVLVCEDLPLACIFDIRGTVERTNTLVLSYDDVKLNDALEQLNAHLKSQLDKKTMFSALAMYDACYAFSFGTSIAAGANGTNFAHSLIGKQLKSLNRDLKFDGTPAILRDYAFFQLDDSPEQFQVVLRLKATALRHCKPSAISACFELEAIVPDQEVWEKRADSEFSECAFKGNRCNTWLWVGIAGAVLGALALLGVLVYCYRLRVRMNQYRDHWKLSSKSFKIIDKPAGGKSNKSMKKRTVNSYALLGSTKAEFLELTQRGKIDFSKEEVQLIAQLTRAAHDNIAKFIGVHYNEGTRFLLLQTFVERATLDDILKNIESTAKKYESKDPTTMMDGGEGDAEDEELTVDMIFKSGFVHDIIKGLTYLHRTIGYHGWLSTHTCLVDANWVLKLTHFGIGRLLHRFNEAGELLSDSIPLAYYVSVAPEHLKDLQYGSVYPLGSQEGDIYSLGIVAHQILFDTDPFTDSVLLTQEVLKKIANGVISPSPPRTSSQFEENLRDLITPCYEASTARPTIRVCSENFNKVFHKSRGNLVDQMLARNAQYANQLEGTVNQRTAMLQEAQQMSYKLLCELLPKSVADKMRMGIRVEPRSYESATVLFCQICNFQAFLARSTAEQVIHFLNNVFTLFDGAIEGKDAYKVETTGETYMVASGVPVENENRHVFIIADIALKIREATHDYSDWKPDGWKLEVRMGFHCGPIATGVIGLKSPRYCLFGDTVNFASRMQSNCAPNQIQVSEVTANLLAGRKEYTLAKRGVVKVKGKGEVNTYWLNEHTAEGGEH